MVDYYDANAAANESAAAGEPVDIHPMCGCGRPLKWGGQAYCPICKKVIDQAMKKAVRLMSGRWIAVQEQPVLYIPGAGKEWLIEYRDIFKRLFNLQAI